MKAVSSCPQGRIEDVATLDGLARGCCQKGASGSSASASENVLVNKRRALRVGDGGLHDRCDGEGRWWGADADCTVLINGRKALRVGDPVRFCGGDGHLAQGSANVLVGNHRKTPKAALRWVGVRPHAFLEDTETAISITVLQDVDSDLARHELLDGKSGRTDGVPEAKYHASANAFVVMRR